MAISRSGRTLNHGVSRATGVLVLLLGCFISPAYGVEVIKSPADDRQYRYLRLPNQLQVLLISDPDSDKAAVALDVFAGSSDDPPDRQGLAHFLEHMLFLGTEKYPRAEEYQAYVNEHGGSHNAYTSPEHTNYFFDIGPDYLEPGLDRFAQFFIAPLFNPDYVERERNAVHSEYQASLNDEYRRTLDVYREVMNPEHPLAKFSVGNLTTLSNHEGDLRRDLLKFYREHYNPCAMSLVVLGWEKLDRLEKMVRERFTKLADREAAGAARTAELEASPNGKVRTESNPLEPLFLPRDLPMRITIEPEKQLRQLSLMFPVPPVEQLYRSKPAEYLGNLLGHEGKGSLFAVLKDRGWAEALTAGILLSTEESATFRVDITLTEAGLSRQQTIVGLVFAAIERIAREGIEEWRFRELQRLGQIAFRFQEQKPALNTVRTLAHNLHYYDAAEVIAGDYLFHEYDAGLIEHFASFLNPNNVVTTVTAPDIDAEHTSRFFSTPYSMETPPLKLAELARALVDQLQLPDPNPFIPNNLALKPRSDHSAQLPSAAPSLIKNAARIRVWFKQDQVFQLPRAASFLRITSPEAANSLRGATLLRLYIEMLRDSLNEYAYPASLAGLHYSLQANSRGVDAMVFGYNDGQDELFRRIIEQMHTPRFSRQRFGHVKSELLRSWENHDFDPPYEQLMRTMSTLLFSPRWSNQQHIDTLVGLDYNDLRRFVISVFVDSHAELLLYGNARRREAAKLAGVVEAELLGATADKTLPAAQVVKLPRVALSGQAPVFAKSVSHGDQAVALYLQGNDNSLTEDARGLLLRQLIRSPFFHQLRTRQQLGYVVFVSAMPFKDVPGSILVVQSPTASLKVLMQATANFVEKTPELVPQDLAQHKSAVVHQLLEAPENLQEQATRYWESIVDHDGIFDRRERLAEVVMAIDPDELSDYLQSTLLEQARALWIVAGPDPLLEASVNSKGKVSQDHWMPIDQWPIFKVERESYLYP